MASRHYRKVIFDLTEDFISEDRLADDAEAAERARRLAKIPPKAPLTCRMIHVHDGISRKNRRAAAKNRQRLQFEGKKANEPIVAEPIKTGTMLDGFC